jgi:hypothetical protein
MTTINAAFDLPRPEDIRAMGFVIRLREADPSSEEVRKLVQDYVITPAAERELPRILDDMKQVYDRGEEYGRFIHGSFGSGKSHFMTMLALLIEDVPPAWDKLRPVLGAHRAAQAGLGRDAPDHQAWLPTANLLVVRVHMLSVRGRSTGLDRAIYDAFNAALKRRGKAPFAFLHLDAIFDEVRREAQEYGDIVWKRLETAGVLSGQAEFEALAAAGPGKDKEQNQARRERFARAWLAYKGRDPDQAGIDPRWSEGLRRMGAHARAQGFGGVVLLIDEFLLWLAEKSGQEFVTEINNLNVIVDHNTGQRPAPIFVFVARQRNLQEFFPDLVDESKIHEHLDHHAKRFEITKLEDVELRHIVKGRVLKKKAEEAVARAVGGLAEQHQRILPALISGADLDYLRDVYPFHPALIEMLVDVTSLMQRERSALRLLYELLILHRDLPLGQFVPIGSAFDALFPRAGVEASKKVELMQDIHHQYYARLQPAMKAMRDAGGDFGEDRHRALDQLVKTVLLAEVSPHLKQGGLTVERLVQLNSVDVEGDTFRGRVRVAETDLLLLSQQVPDLQVAGGGKTAIVRYVLGRATLSEVLARARSKVDNLTKRYEVFYHALKEALGLLGEKGFEEGGANEGDFELQWRRTKRRGRIKLGNVREMSVSDFEPPEGAFKILVDYPWDDPGHTVDEDRLRAMNARRSRGTMYAACWLPRHMSPTELGVITELAAVRYLLSGPGKEELLELHNPQDRNKILEQAAVRQKTLEGQLHELLREVYVQHGEFVALLSDVDGSRPHKELAENLVHISTLLMDRRYPQHPSFGAEPRKADLEALLSWMVQAGEANVSVAYDESVAKVLRNLGQPLELCNLGQTKASLRLDSRYIKDVLARTDQDSVRWQPIAEHLRATYGLQAIVVDLFLCFLCQRDHRALHEVTGEQLDVHIGMSQSVPVRLQRGTLVGPAEWHRLRDLGNQLFGVTRPPAHRSLQGQDRFAGELRKHGSERRVILQGLHQRLVHLGVSGGDRLSEIAEANARLKPLDQKTTDSYKVLSELLGLWPDDAADPLRALTAQAGGLRDALAELNDHHAVSSLKLGAEHPQLGEAVREHLAALAGRLAAAQAEQPITIEWVKAWNRKAQQLIQEIIARPPAPTPTPPPSPVPVPVPAPAPRREPVLCEASLDPSDPDAVSSFLAEVRKALSRLDGEGREVQVALVRRGEQA